MEKGRSPFTKTRDEKKYRHKKPPLDAAYSALEFMVEAARITHQEQVISQIKKLPMAK